MFIAFKQCTDVTVNSPTQITVITPMLGSPGAKRVTVKCGNVDSVDTVDVNVLALSPRAYVQPASSRSTEKQNLLITINGITEQLGDISQYAVHLQNEAHTLHMKVNEYLWTNSKNQIKVRFPGGYLGDYTLHVSHTKYGKLEQATPFRIGATITSILPREGSLAGGTLITVTGTDFDPKGSAVYFGRSLCVTKGTPSTT